MEYSELISEIKRGKKEKFSYFINNYQPLCLYYLAEIKKMNWNQSCDVVNEVFATLFFNISDFNEEDSVILWVLQRCLKAYNNQQTDLSVAELENTKKHQITLEINEYILSLTEAQKEIFALLFLFKLNSSEVCNLLSINLKELEERVLDLRSSFDNNYVFNGEASQCEQTTEFKKELCSSFSDYELSEMRAQHIKTCIACRREWKKFSHLTNLFEELRQNIQNAMPIQTIIDIKEKKINWRLYVKIFLFSVASIIVFGMIFDIYRSYFEMSDKLQQIPPLIEVDNLRKGKENAKILNSLMLAEVLDGSLISSDGTFFDQYSNLYEIHNPLKTKFCYLYHSIKNIPIELQDAFFSLASDAISLNRGDLFMDAQELDDTFVINTPMAKLTVLRASFSVNVDLNSETRVQVLYGKIDLLLRETDEELSLKAGDVFIIEKSGSVVPLPLIEEAESLNGTPILAFPSDLGE